MGAMDRVRDIAYSGMGIGSASFYVDVSGEAALLRRLASLWPDREEIVVLDVGAHTGTYALAARAAFGPRAQIHCFEPNPALFEFLQPRLEHDPGIACHEAALSSESGSAPLFLDRTGSSRASLIEDSFDVTGRAIVHTHEVSVTTLDGFAGDAGISYIDVLKLDVEGHELEVLRGAGELLARGAIDVVQFEFGERNLASRTYLRDFFELLGPSFTFFRITPRGLVELEYRPKIEVFALETNYVAVSGKTTGLTSR